MHPGLKERISDLSNLLPGILESGIPPAKLVLETYTADQLSELRDRSINELFQFDTSGYSSQSIRWWSPDQMTFYPAGVSYRADDEQRWPTWRPSNPSHSPPVSPILSAGDSPSHTSPEDEHRTAGFPGPPEAPDPAEDDADLKYLDASSSTAETVGQDTNSEAGWLTIATVQTFSSAIWKMWES